MALLSSELFGASHTARILSFVTIFFAIGQIAGPVGGGNIVDIFEGFSHLFLFSSLLALFAFFLASWVDKSQKKI